MENRRATNIHELKKYFPDEIFSDYFSSDSIVSFISTTLEQLQRTSERSAPALFFFTHVGNFFLPTIGALSKILPTFLRLGKKFTHIPEV